MRPEQEQELAYTLMVELLAYQFASPVRWIETQDVILSQHSAERLVEIGPSDTLGGMARRTLAAKYEAYDAAQSLQRQILCYNKDAKEIYYDVEPVEEEETPEVPVASSSAPANAPAASAPVAAAAPAPSSGPAAQVADAPVQAVDIVRSLIAQKLKKSLAEIPLSKAIKDLVNGKSTLQNEILGDLQKEFGNTPEKPEDTPLDELGAAMQTTFNGQLGKQSSSMIARMISSKMPGGFNITTARKYLGDRWGLQSGRQDGVLLMAITMEPAARLGSENDAKAFLDDVSAKYAIASGISLSAPAAGGSSGGGGGGMMMDPAAIDALTKDQRALFKQQLELLARYLKMDLRSGDKAYVGSLDTQKVLQAQLDLWNVEHGEFYASGIEPSFSPLKARVYDSSWNWARQDALHMYFDIVFGRLKLVDREIVSRCIHIMNRSNPTLLEYMQYHIDHCPTERGETYKLAKELGEQLIANCQEALGTAPVFKDVQYPTAPQTTIDAQGNMSYAEVPRPAIRKLEHYVKEMAAGGKLSEYGNRTKVQNDLAKIYKIIKQQHKITKSSQMQIKTLYANIFKSLAMNEAQILHEKGANNKKNNNSGKGKVECIPFLHLRRKEDHGWEYSKKLTGLYLDCLEQAAASGVTFDGKNVLMTGAGAGSIGAEVLQGLLSGGARVVVTTSRFSREVTEYYQTMYTKFGARGSQLIVVPFNQGSKQDCEALVNWVYDAKNGLGWDLDFVIPFAAISENGREIDGLDSKSELAHRIMLTNLLRLLGMVKTNKASRGYETRPAQVILPLSPNHGTFGNDGMYSESKLALETLFTRWHSESWGNYLTICGAVIGWTRGTGLMGGNNSIAEGVEKLGVRTFSQQEMAFNLLGLMAPAVVNLCQVEPVFADLNGGFQYIPNLKEVSAQLRQNLQETCEVRKAVTVETAIEHKIVNGEESEKLYQKVTIQPRANMKFSFPELPDYKKEIEPLAADLRGMVDLEKVVVVTGFAEVGPWGNSRTRWEMEAYGHFSLEGCIEMAWIMGLIKHFKGPIKGKPYSGWVDAKTNEPVDDKDVKAKYEKHILEHSGIRLIESELFGGYDPKRKELLQEVVIEQDLEQFETSKENAQEFKRQHGDKVEIFELKETGEYTVRLKKGALLYVPKALKFDRLVAGQIPAGWDARRYGIPEDIITQVDPVTLYVLVSVVEALLASGITDPYEFYKYVHLSEVGNCVGSGVGGVSALRGMYKGRWQDKPIQKDILQESFINTMSAWVNMLLLSSTGPIKTPVGACATAVESLDIGYETIVEGKARVCFVGGFDDFQEEGSYEFANMKATSNAEEEIAHGRTPAEMSRPTTTTRNGFMESQGCGVQLIMSAKLALEMGVPIYGIVALTATATDKIGRSIPAPGQGILTTAREASSKFPSPLLDIKYRKRQLDMRKAQIKQWTESELMYLQEEVAAMKSQGTDFDESEYMQDRAGHIERESQRQESEALNAWGNNFWKKDPRIAPLRGALATWGLTIDDLGVASFHGTSTKANDKNESDAIQKMLTHLGRKKGNAILGIFQKYLTGHPKGAAGAWMMNGAIQCLNSGLVPGNRNADNVDQKLEQFDYILYPSRSIQTDGIKAFSVTSFGFGQKGAQAIGVHAKYLFATLDEQTYEAYKAKVNSRYKKAYRYYHTSLVENNMFQAKNDPPYTADQETQVLLDPLARVQADKKTNSYMYPAQIQKKPADPSVENTRKLVENLASATAGDNSKIGVDVELISSINIDNENFVERNFTVAEQEYCRKAPSAQASFAGRWSAKEAVFKALGVASKGAGAPCKKKNNNLMAAHSIVNLSPSPTTSPTFLGNGGAPIPAAMFNPGHASSDDGGTDPKRRRIARACDMCRKKKIKCDGKLPSCTHCVNYKTECVFTLVEKKRNPPKGAKYIEGLENRLGRMESLLKLSGLLPEGDGKTDLGDLERRLQDQVQQQQAASQNGSVCTPTVGRSSSESMRETPTSSSMHSVTNSPAISKEEDEVEALSDQMCSLVTNNCGETRFIGSSSGFSIFSPKGIQWVNEKTGDKSFQQMIMEATSADSKWSMWKQDIFGPLFEHRGENELPTKEVASALVQDFFRYFNVCFPLFHKPTFDALFERHYSETPPPKDSGWYAAFNMVLAIALRIQISHPGLPDEDTATSHVQESWQFFQNAASVLTELLLKNTDLVSIQAILGMALYLQGTANPQPSYFLIAAAVRISNSIGMHRRGNSFGLNSVEVEQRRRVFWIMYLLDKDMALRSGRPPCINDDDISVELPDEDPADDIGNIMLKNGKDKCNLFRLMATFSVIESKVYMQLYSAKAARQSDGELLNTIGDLDKELEEWKESVPLEYRPDSEIDLNQGPLVLHLVMLHFAYYNCLTTIHRMSIHHGYWSSRLSNYAIAGLSARPLNPRVFSSAALCVAAARSSIHLIKYINRRDYPCIWLIMYYPVSALVTLFANVLQNPQDARARSDLRLMNVVVEFLQTVQKEDDSNKQDTASVQRMLAVCGEFHRIAKLVLDKAESENVSRRKRKNDDSRHSVSYPHKRDASSSPRTNIPQATSPRTETASPPTSVLNPEINSQLFGDYPTAFSPSNPLSWLNEMNTPASTFPVSPNAGHVGLDTQGLPQMSGNSFQQPFVPQDLWQMPMTFEWDWADVNTQVPWGHDGTSGL